jgi:dolichol kinase
VLLGGVLLAVTQLYQPKLWSCGGGSFWLTMIAATAAQMGVGIVGGGLARCYCLLDEHGLYTITSPKSYFKVNYTRKLQHLAAYVIPLLITPPSDCMPESMYPQGNADTLGLIQAWWAHFFTLLGFLALIKPLRESFTILMLQFNSMDRPEDRPNCLNWLIGGNVFPGYCLLIPLRFLFGYSCQQSLIYVVIFIVGLGDGFAEPVGVNLGVHKYQSRGCDCGDGEGEVRYYTRSWEGSATVFLSGILFPCIQYYQFANAEQFILALLLLPPFVTVAEATAPHTMDTVSLILVAAGILLALFWIFPSGHIDPSGNPSCSNPGAH